MKALAIDCAVSRLTIAAKNEGKTCTCIYDIGMKQSEILVPSIEYVLSKVDLTSADLDYTVLTEGPGSFTGLRLGFSALKAIELAYNVPVYGISSLKASVPGIRFSFLHNVVLKQGSMGEGEVSYSIFAGPGVMAGYVLDRDMRQGIAVGLTGDMGVRFDFPSSFAVGIFLQGDLALHMKIHSQTTVSLYQNGLYQAWIPVLSISYNFR